MRILLCTDGSPHGQAALRFGALIARASPEAATLLGVLEQPALWSAWRQHSRQNSGQEAGERGQLERALDEGRRWLAEAPAPEVKIRVGHAAEEILAEAASGEYELVVVGARGRRGITPFLLGSTSERIARHAPVPVLVVKGERAALKRILLCTAGAAPGLVDAEIGGQVARLVKARVTVMHVMSQVATTAELPQPLLQDLEAPAEVLMARNTREGTHLQQMLSILADLGVPALPLVRHGLVVDEILTEASAGDYDLIVIGAHRAEGLMRFLLDDVAHQILSHADRPVLVARALRTS